MLVMNAISVAKASEDAFASSLYYTLVVTYLFRKSYRLANTSFSYDLTSSNQSTPTGVPCCKQW